MNATARNRRGALRLLTGTALTLPGSAGDEPAPGRSTAFGPRRRLPRPASGHHAYVVRRCDHHSGWLWWLQRSDHDQLARAPEPAPTSGHARRDTLRVRLAAATGPVETFADPDGRFGWRLMSRAGAIVAVSAIGYASRLAAERAVAAFRREASHAELDDG